MTSYEGGCYCGAVRFRVETDLRGVTVCNCSMCTKKGFLHLIVPPERFQLICGEDMLSEFRAGTRIAKHQFCKVCGIHGFYVPRSDPDKIDVNVRCLDGVDVSTLKLESFDGASWDAAILAHTPWRQTSE